MYTSQQENQILQNNIIDQVTYNPQFIHCMELLIELQRNNHITNALWPSNDYIQNIDDTIHTYYSAHPLAQLWIKTSPILAELSQYQQFCILYYLLDMDQDSLSKLWHTVEKARKKGLA